VSQPGPKALPMGERIQPRPSRRKRRKFDHGEPIWRIDTRPMVFVFGFIALMLLLSASVVKQHATVISLWDGTSEQWWLAETRQAASSDHHAIKNRLTLSEDDLLQWNGEAIDLNSLVTLAYELDSIVPQPVVEFEPAANASYDMSAKVIHILWDSGSRFQIAGIEQHCLFGNEWQPVLGGNSGSLDIATTVFFFDSKLSEHLQSYDPHREGAQCSVRPVIHDGDLIAEN